MPKVIRSEIIGTRMVVLSAWEPSVRLGSITHGHATITTLDGACYGRIGTRRLPAELEALPAMSAVRSAAVGAWQQAQYGEAVAAILAQYPGAIDGVTSMGEITIIEGEG